MLAKYGQKVRAGPAAVRCASGSALSWGAQVVVCEAHDAPGGAAHEFKVGDYSFDSGPSFFAGLSGGLPPHKHGLPGGLPVQDCGLPGSDACMHVAVQNVVLFGRF